MTNVDERIIRLEEIALERAELEEAILKMDLKLEETKVKQMTLGIMPDVEWLYRIKHALGMKKIQLKRLNVEHEKIKRVLKQERTLIHNERSKNFERNFVKVAKEILSVEDFEKIKNLANEITNSQIEVDKSKEFSEEEDEPKVVKKGTAWSKEDEEYLKENYKNATIEELSIALGRSENSIRSKIQVIKKRL